jgi:uncharacterized protein (TIGR02118 family)
VVKTIILFGTPADQATFDRYFTDNHRPVLLKVPNLEELVVNRIAGTAKGDSPYCLMVEMHFASEEAMQAGLNSEGGQTMAEELSKFASGGVMVLFAQSVVEPLGSP